jgi:serine/threonine protein phosphatase 1
MKRWAIGDIHGCSKTLEALLEKLPAGTGDELYFLGDYVDRGPDSKGVLDIILQLEKQGISAFCIRGNHDQMMLAAREDEENFRRWVRNGGAAALDSFRTENLEEIEPKYWEFLEGTHFYVETDGFIFVHAGLNFERPDPFSDTDSMLWVRDWWELTDKKWLGDRSILHGHTPVSLKTTNEQLRQLKSNRHLDLDTGCVYPQTSFLGNLTALDLDTLELVSQRNVDF